MQGRKKAGQRDVKREGDRTGGKEAGQEGDRAGQEGRNGRQEGRLAGQGDVKRGRIQ